MLKYLRIAVTALSLTACVLLIALWVRSYWHSDGLEGGLLGWFVEGESTQGQIRGAAYHSGYTGAFVVDTFAIGDFEASPLRLDFGYWDGGAGVWVPHWFLTLVCGSFAVAPWLPWLRRFSVRTLLIAITLVAAALGSIAVWLRE
jgi:hypothetical protein